MDFLKCFSNKVVMVTGGSGGLGFSIAKKFIDYNAKVFVTSTTKKKECPSGGHLINCNFLEDDNFESFLSTLDSLKIDILVNNAGINKINEFEKISYNDFKEIQIVNTNAPFRITQKVIKNMKEKNWGRIINISSIFGKVSKKYRASYSASKFAIDGITAALAAEVAEYNILVNTVSPGFFETQLTKSILGIKGMREVSSILPIKRLGKPEELSNLILWLSSEYNTYISGQNIIIDGGFTRV